MKAFLALALICSLVLNAMQSSSIQIRDATIRTYLEDISVDDDTISVLAQGLEANGSIANHNRDVAKALSAELRTCRGFKDL